MSDPGLLMCSSLFLACIAVVFWRVLIRLVVVAVVAVVFCGVLVLAAGM